MHIGGTLTAIAISVVFMLYLNGDIGWALIYIIGGTAVLSLVIFFISVRHFKVKLSELSGVTEFGRNIELEFTLQKTGFCLLPFIELCVDAGAGDYPIRIRTALLWGKEKRVKASFVAAHCGLNRVTLSQAVVNDFLGLARKRVKLEQSTQKAVLPRVVEYDGPEILPNTLPSEEEEIEEGVTVRTGGMPGYEHRDYTPGDSPRRVNYKLSAKKGKLMVRLDESQGSKTTNIYLTENALPACADKAFALASRLVVRGGTVRITHKGDERTAATPETLDRMREWLAFREFAENLEALPDDIAPPETTVIFSGGGVITQLDAG